MRTTITAALATIPAIAAIAVSALVWNPASAATPVQIPGGPKPTPRVVTITLPNATITETLRPRW